NTTNRLKTIQNRKQNLKKEILEEVNLLQAAGVTVDPAIYNFKATTSSHGSGSNASNSYLSLLEKNSDANFLQRIQHSLDKIPVSNGGRYYKPLNLNIGMIADEFLFQSYKDAANMIYINRENYQDHQLDVFIVASAWKGLDNSWKGLGNPNNTKLRAEIDKIIAH